LFGNQRNRRERVKTCGTHMFFISLHMSEERAEKGVFFQNSIFALVFFLVSNSSKLQKI